MNDVVDSSLGSDSATSAVPGLPGQVGQTRRPFSGLGSTVTGTGTTTGSWAESTHSVIWLTRGGNRLPLARVGRRSWGTNLISVAVIALTSLIAASNLLDVYGSAAMWAVAAVPATLLGALIAYAGTAPALRLWWQIVFLIVAQGVIGPVIALNDTAISHVIPSVETLSQGFVSTFGAFKYLIAVPPPTGSGDGSLMAAWTICLWLSFLAGVFATQTGFQPIASGVLIGLIMIVWLSWRWQLLELGRWISATIILLLAAGLGVGACMGIGQSRLILRDYYDPPLSPYDYASPLSGLRSYVKDHKDDTLLTVTNLPEGTPVRLAVMDQFDGNVWNLSDSTEASDSSDYRRVGTRIPNTVDGKKFTATFTIDKGLSDKWLPLAGAASSVDVTSAGKTGGANGNGGGESRSSADHTLFYYNESTQSAIIPAGLSTGMTYTESGIIAPTPTDKEIAKANAAVTNQPGTKDVPDSVGKFASSVAGGEDTAGAQAQALVAQLKDSGWFSHGLTGDYPSLPGHGSYRINALLAGSAMVGDSEQYASAMALMARELGLPSRVVMGFLPKNDDGDISNDRTETVNGTSTVKFTGNDIEAWVEINLEGYGWVAFYPTPKETKIPDDNQNLTPPNPQTLVRQPPVPLTDPLRDEEQAHGKSALAGEDATDEPAASIWSTIGRIAAKVAIYGSPVWIPLLICLLILALKTVALARLRRYGDARQRITSGWQAVHALAGQSGIPVTGTRRDQAQAIARQLNIDGAPLIALGRQADYAAFSGQPVTPEQAGAYWRSVLTTRKLMLASQSFMRRLRTRLSLRGVFHNVRILSSIRTWRHGDKRKPDGRQPAKQRPVKRHATTIRTATLLTERPTVMNDMQIHVAADSNIGLRRRANQDSFIIDDGVFLVCDGMGGGVGGQRASSAAVDRFETLASRFSRSRTTIGRTIDLAQADVLAIGQELGGVSGTTVTGLIAPGRIERDAPGDVALDINPDMDWYVINIGDSRTYHMDADSDGQWDASTLCRITRDHSRRQEAIDSGEMLPEDAVIIPRNIITQCIGDPDGINPDFFAVRPTGRFIICSDGLHGEVDDAAIAATAAACADPQTAVDELIRIALEAGGTDNVTVIVLDITGEYAGQKVWHASRLAQQEDLETVSDETLDTIRIQKPANQI